ncbi:hypothetical protein AQUCO_00400724v1 [Aquilegia coerulea]|uniref:WRKY domain-containing protein n=1 Tax=Aquilegia coerulea TaxID=218851 RepID=A0A2G5EWE3_AQUCA|nr:hypothetical protein AQUCO_00400724v1 [Aquilegia coerulea]
MDLKIFALVNKSKLEVLGYDLQTESDIEVMIVLVYNSQKFGGGAKFPSWIGEPLFTKLTNITIHDRRNCKVLPPLGQLPSLESLCISDMHPIKVIDHHFCARNMGMESLDSDRLELGTTSEYMSTASMFNVFPALKNLTINGMPMLNGVEWKKEGLPTLLQYLVIINCQFLKEKCLYDEEEYWQKFGDIPNIWIDYQQMTKVSSASNQTQNVEVADASHHSPAPVQAQADIECQAGLLKQTMIKNYATGSPPTIEDATNMVVDSNYLPLRTFDTGAASEQAPQLEEQVHVDDTCDRKYGEKQVKGSAFPRSYYKCTYQNCQVKKKIERSHDGQITEIIYKGGHNHSMPQPSRRSAHESYVDVEGGSAWRSIPQGSKDSKVASDWRSYGLETTSSTSVLPEVSYPFFTAKGKQLGIVESADTPELSSTLVSLSLGDDADDDDSESKRRRKDSCLIGANMTSRAVRKPRVVVQTDSEVEILDDGYRWRKYGQKHVKGNPNPRSYYKCTSDGCSVRKHVERASHDPKCLITTYEGNTIVSTLSSPFRSPYLTIPPGLSPTSLLDSPAMLPCSQPRQCHVSLTVWVLNGRDNRVGTVAIKYGFSSKGTLAQPSPTTGTLPESCYTILATCNVEKDKDDGVDSSFMFKPHPISFQYHPELPKVASQDEQSHSTKPPVGTGTPPEHDDWLDCTET